ncbi:hypothetical protein J7K25_07790 [bacterium]|nr:hypothetical protein [bacterium]
MKIDFQIVHTVKSDLKKHLLDLLKQTLDESTIIEVSVEEKPENIQNWEIFNWIEIKYNHSLEENRFIAGFSLDISEDYREIIREFGDHLKDDENIEVVFKYFNESMSEKHKSYAEEIFEIEMKLREIISFIFIDTYKGDYHNLLKEIDVKIQPLNGNNKPDKDYFERHFENEFFFLLFSDYMHLSEPKKISQNDLMEFIINSNDYDELKRNIQNRGITKEKYQDMIASIKQNLKPIEDMRNCIAHNRSFTDTVLQNYQQAKANLYNIINQFWEELENES